MSDRRDAATYRALVPGASPRTEITGFGESLALLIRMVGSQQRTAEALGVPRRTLRRWVAGENQPSAERRRVVIGAARRIVRRNRLSPRVEARKRAATTIRIVGEDRYDGQERDVTFRVGKRGATSGLAPEVFGRLVDAFLAGQSGIDRVDGAGQNDGLFFTIVRGMTDTSGFYQGLFSSTDRDWGVDVYKVSIR